MYHVYIILCTNLIYVQDSSLNITPLNFFLYISNYYIKQRVIMNKLAELVNFIFVNAGKWTRSAKLIKNKKLQKFECVVDTEKYLEK